MKLYEFIFLILSIVSLIDYIITTIIIHQCKDLCNLFRNKNRSTNKKRVRNTYNSNYNSNFFIQICILRRNKTMLSDEEKKAIDVLKYVKNKTPFIFWYEEKPYNRKETINIILNLIEKQSKEIEELKKYEEGYKLLSYSLDNYISKDKIKAKIEEIDEVLKGQLIEKIRVYFEAQKEVLQSLLEKE